MNYYKEIKNELINNEITKRVKNYSNNRSDLNTYYNVGKLIVEAQGGEERAKYGDGLIKEYSIKLTKELGKGYSTRSLKRMRKFYICFPKATTLSSQLSWSHYLELIKIDEEPKRNFYMHETINSNWSVRELQRQRDSLLYERLILSSHKEKILEISSIFFYFVI